MSAEKDKVRELLNKLPEDCTLEDVQYHLYVLEKVQRGIARAETEGAMSQDDVEKHLRKWTAE
jgi:predicted transcriptional regulator